MRFLCFLILFNGFNDTDAQETARRLNVAHIVNSTVDLSCWGLVASLNDSPLTGSSLVPGKLDKGGKRNMTSLRCEHAGEMNCDYHDGKGEIMLELSVIGCPPRLCPNIETQQVNIGDKVTFIICVLISTPKVGVPLMVSYNDKWLKKGQCVTRFCVDWDNKKTFEYTLTLTLINATTADLTQINIKLGSNYDYRNNSINHTLEFISANGTRFSYFKFYHIVLMSVVPSSILILLTATVLVVYKQRGGTVETRNEPTSTSLRGLSWYTRDILDKRCLDEEHFYQPACHEPRPRDEPLNTQIHLAQTAELFNSHTYTAPNNDVNSHTYTAPNDDVNAHTYSAPNDDFHSHTNTTPNYDVNSHTYTAPNYDVNSHTDRTPNDDVNSHTYTAPNYDVNTYLVPKDEAFNSHTYLTPYQTLKGELFYFHTYLPTVGAPSEVFYEQVY